MNIDQRLPTYFLSHGGGPWPWMKGPFRDSCSKLEASLKELPIQLGVVPKAILMVSGHWEAPEFTVMTNPAPPTVYDYSGFPEHTYKIRYGASGSLELANRVQSLLSEAGITVHADPNRGFDHGMFAPLAVVYPRAEVPVVQLSLKSNYDPYAHIQVGRALAPLRDQGILIVGSGLSYHNLRRFDAGATKPSQEFDAWLQQTLLKSEATERTSKLINWEQAPSSRLAHPQEDHLLPLMVAVGAAEDELGQLIYHEDDFMGGIAVSSFRFG